MCSISAKSYGDPWPLASLSMRFFSSEVPTRHGVQKPQLSCAKKCVKLRATSNMSRVASKTMKAPAVGTSSNGDPAPNSATLTQVPDGRRPARPAFPVATGLSTSPTVTPNGNS